MATMFRTFAAPRRARLRVEGELDLATHDELRHRLRALCRRPCRVLELDVAEVSFVDAGCLRALDEARQVLAARGGRLEVVAASHCFALVSHLAGYDALDVAPARPRLTLLSMPPLHLVDSADGCA